MKVGRNPDDVVQSESVEVYVLASQKRHAGFSVDGCSSTRSDAASEFGC